MIAGRRDQHGLQPVQGRNDQRDKSPTPSSCPFLRGRCAVGRRLWVFSANLDRSGARPVGWRVPAFWRLRLESRMKANCQTSSISSRLKRVAAEGARIHGIRRAGVLHGYSVPCAQKPGLRPPSLKGDPGAGQQGGGPWAATCANVSIPSPHHRVRTAPLERSTRSPCSSPPAPLVPDVSDSLV